MNNLQVERDRDEDLKSIKKIDKFIYILVFGLLALTPIIVQAHFINYVSPTASNFSYLQTGNKAEIFSFYKWLTLIILVSLMLVFFLYKIFLLDDKFKFNSINIITLFSIGIISIIYPFNNSGYLSYIGTYERYEGFITYIVYLVLFLIVYNTSFSRKQLKNLILALYPVIIINFVTVFSSVIDNSIVGKKWFYNLVTLFERPQQQLDLAQSNQVFTTLYNQNMISGLSAALCIVFVISAMNESRALIKMTHSLMSILSLILVFLSFSASGIITLIVLIFISIIGLIINNKVLNKKVVILISSFILIFTIVFAILMNVNSKVEKQVLQAWTDITQVFDFDQIERIPQKDEAILPDIPKRGYSWGSGRGFIWNESLNMVKDQPLMGYGFETMSYELNQYSLEKTAYFMNYTTVIDKPHNWYISLAYNSGVIFLVIIVLLVGTVIYKKINYLLFKENRFGSVKLALLTGVIGILIQWLVNDSTIGVAVIFWSLLGLINVDNGHKEDGVL